MSPPAVAIFDPCKSTEMTTEISSYFTGAGSQRMKQKKLTRIGMAIQPETG